MKYANGQTIQTEHLRLTSARKCFLRHDVTDLTAWRPR